MERRSAARPASAFAPVFPAATDALFAPALWDTALTADTAAGIFTSAAEAYAAAVGTPPAAAMAVTHIPALKGIKILRLFSLFFKAFLSP